MKTPQKMAQRSTDTLPQEPALTLRLALSHAEKLRRTIDDCEKAYREGRIDANRYKNLRARYDVELTMAQRMLERLRSTERARLDAFQAQLNAAFEEQAHLAERVQLGALTPRQANDANRRLLSRITELESEIREARARMDVATAQEAGGFVDLPLPEYTAAIGARLGPKTQTARQAPMPPRTSWGWAVPGLLAVVAAASVFLPWLPAHGETVSLVGAVGVLLPDAEGVTAQSAVMRVLWLLYIALPFAAIPLTSSRRPFAKGWGILAIGLVMLAGAILPGALSVTQRLTAEAAIPVLAAFRGGPLLYAFAALAFIVLGALRVSPVSDSLTNALMASGILLLVMIGFFGVIAALMITLPSLPAVTMEANLSGSDQGAINLRCRNLGRDPVTLYMPWPEGKTEPAALVSGPVYGIHVYVREVGDQTFRLAPYSTTIWTAPGAPVAQNAARELPPGLTLSATLDLRQLTALGTEPQAVRIVLTRGRDAVIDTFETTLADRHFAPPAESRRDAAARPAL